jgi:anti-anti-sigma factor
MPTSPVTSAEHLPRATVVHVLAAELRNAEIDAVCTGVDDAMALAPKLPVILDMAKVSFAGSMAMGTLVGLNKEFITRGQRLIVVGVQEPVRQAIAMTRIDKLMEFMPDVATALRSVDDAAATRS